MHTSKLNPSANRCPQAVGGGASLHTLEAVAASDDVFPPLKLAVTKALGIIEIIKKFNFNKRAWIACSDTLIRKVEEIIWYTRQFHKGQVPSALQSWLEDLKGTLDHLKESALDIHQQGLRKFRSSTQDQEYIEKFEGKVNEAMSSFHVLQYEENIQTDSTTTAEQVKTTEANQDGTTEAQITVFAGAQDIQMDHSVIIAGQVVHYNNIEELQEKINIGIEESKADKWLQELKAPLHGKPAERCMAGTRVDVLTNVEAWVNDLSMPNILWLSGSPGSGKTTIASTVVAGFEQFSGQFFFHRDQAELQNPDNLWRRLALDLAQGNIALKTSIAQALEAQKANIRGLDISMQFEHLIVKPLQEVSQSSVKPLLLVVDALDECNSYEKLLPSLQSFAQLSKSLKLLVTSRRYHDIQNALKPVSYHIDLHAGDEVSDQTANDLWKYFITRFLEGTKLHTSALYLNWPGLEKISFLVEKAAGLFIWAKSAMDFILYKGGDMKERLEAICSNSGEGTDAIDALYHHIISAAFQGLRETEKNYLSSVLGSIVVARNPLCCSDLEQLLGVRDALSIISQLSPILSISETGHVQICHQSVTEFLLDLERSKAFWVDSKKHSLCLAGSCMKYMSAKLKFNFFGLNTSHILNKDIPNLMDYIKNVKSTALDHASYFWAIYLQNYPDEVLQKEIIVQMEKFLMGHLLHWLEIMSIMGAVNHAAWLLLLAENWCKVLKPSMSEFASDANQFIMTFFEPISDAAPHIYISALPFAPQNSKISLHFMKYFANTLKFVDGQMKYWSERCVLRIKGGNRSVAYSPNGRHIVSGSPDRNLHIWDALTGHSVMNLVFHDRHLASSVAYSPNGKHIVSGSWNGEVRVWNALTGQCIIDPLKSHDDVVTSVAFSPDDRHFVSGSRDKTIRVWSSLTGQSVPLKGHGDYVTSVTYSPSGRQIISGSFDHTIRIWDAGTGHCVIDPLECHGAVTSVAVSPNARSIVSGSLDSTITIWDAPSGQRIMVLFRGSNPINTVAFSPDGKHIVCATQSHIIRFWDALTSQCLSSPLEHNEDSVFSAAFSPNGKHIISGCGNNMIKVWDAQTGHAEVDHVRRHDNEINSVAFSPNCKDIVSGCADGTLRVWDALTGLSVMGPLRGHHNEVSSVAFSPDGKYIASGSFDCTVRVWDALTGKSLPIPHNSAVMSVAFSPDGKCITSGSDYGSVRVWDALTGQKVMDPFRGHSGQVSSVAFCSDGRLIVSGSVDCTIRVWDAQTGQSAINPLVGHKGNVTSVAFSPDRQHIVSGSIDQTVRVWDYQTGQSLMYPLGSNVYSVAFSSDGRYIVSGSLDKTVRLWDTVTGHCVVDPFRGHRNAVQSVVFSPDGRYIASASRDNTIRIWDAQTDSTSLNPSASSVVFPSTLLLSEVRNNVDDPSTHCIVSHIFKDKTVTFYPADGGNWMMGEDSKSYLFWVPPSNRHGLFFPRTINVLNSTPTRLDFSNFVHGTNWSQCFSPAL